MGIIDDPLTKRDRRLADFLYSRKGPAIVTGRASDWYSDVRDIADVLYRRPAWSDGHRQTLAERQWQAFTDRAGYLS